MIIDKGSRYPIYAVTLEEYDALAQEYLKKFGMPAESLFKLAEDGKVILGGCCYSDESPDRGCLDCHYHWNRKTKEGRLVMPQDVEIVQKAIRDGGFTDRDGVFYKYDQEACHFFAEVDGRKIIMGMD
jgi:hypothetical protein